MYADKLVFAATCMLLYFLYDGDSKKRMYRQITRISWNSIIIKYHRTKRIKTKYVRLKTYKKYSSKSIKKKPKTLNLFL